MTEAEYKLTADSYATLAAAYAAIDAPEHAVLDMESVYFDTAARALHRSGYTLRFRTENGRGRMTCKRSLPESGAQGFFQRLEWEQAADTPEAGVDALCAALPEDAAVLLRAHRRQLAPVFSVSFTRREKTVRLADAAVVCALDCGVFNRCADRPFWELECELASETPNDAERSALHAFAQELAARFRLTAQPFSKAARAAESKQNSG